jgi:hypothetical protein
VNHWIHGYQILGDVCLSSLVRILFEKFIIRRITTPLVLYYFGSFNERLEVEDSP